MAVTAIPISGYVTTRGKRQLDVSVLRGSQALQQLKAEWNELVTGSLANPFLSWGWVTSWTRHFSGAHLLTIVAKDDGRVVGIAPFHENRYASLPGLSGVALQLGGPREVIHLGEWPPMAIEPGREAEVLQAMIRSAATSFEWDWIEFSLSEHQAAALEPVFDAVKEIAVRHQIQSVRMPVMDLERSWSEQIRHLRRNVKESIRRSNNRFRCQGSDPQVVICKQVAEVDQYLDRFFQLHTARAGLSMRVAHHDNFKGSATRDFLRDAARAMMGEERLQVTELRIADHTIASRISLRASNTLYLYSSGFDARWWEFGPMTFLDAELFKCAAAEGYAHVNFSPGLDQAKTRWPVRLEGITHIVLVRPNLASQLRFALVESRKSIVANLRRRSPIVRRRCQ